MNECIIDTGFEGAPALPADAVTALGHPLYQRIFANLADNSVVRLDGFRAATVWKGQELIVAFLAMGRRPLFGTALLSGKELVARFVDNGLLTVVDV